MGRLAGILANSRNVAAGIGFYAAALSVYDLWLAHGHDVAFVKNTRVEITTMPGRSPINGPGKMEQSPYHSLAGCARGCKLVGKNGRGERIRTSDPLVPNQVLYQAEPLPELAVERMFTG